MQPLLCACFAGRFPALGTLFNIVKPDHMNQGGPTKEAFDKLLRWLDPDREKAGEKYERIRFRLIRILAAKGCYDAEDLTDKTINIVVSKIDWLLENYKGDPTLYFYAVGKKIFLEYRKKKPVPATPPPDPDSLEIERVCNCLDQCLEELPQHDRQLALRYQQGEKRERSANRKRLADELGISVNALRIRMYHIHSKLRESMERRFGQFLGG